MSSAVSLDYPSMALGQIVDERALQALGQIGALQSKTDAALDTLNSLVGLRRGLSMMMNELQSLEIDTSELSDEIKALNGSIKDAARTYMTTRIANDTAIHVARETMSGIAPDGVSVSPIDFVQSKVLSLPLFYDSIKMDVQYFSYTGSETADVERSIRESTAALGAKSQELAKAAGAQISLQRMNHDLSGTLVISATCTHRESAMLEPLVLDVDKAIAIWNTGYAGKGLLLDDRDPAAMKAMANESEGGSEKHSFTVLTGVNYGSSFVGMIHFVNRKIASSDPSSKEISDLQERLKLGGWLENAAGGVGVDSTVVEDIRRFVNSQNMSSHVNVIVLGAVPSIAAGNLKMGVGLMLEADSDALTGTMSKIDSLTASSRETVQTGAVKAQTASRMSNMRSGTMRSLAQSLATVDSGSNKVLDLNSLMTAFENYLTTIKEKKSATGVPIGFFLKRVSAREIARLWMDKYELKVAAAAAAAATSGR